jgi:uncharacterized protein (TIGR02145 family)
MKNIFTIGAILFSFVLEAQQSGEFIDKRDGKKYKTTVIGGQVWMAENLNVSKFRNGDPIPEAKTAEEWASAVRYGIAAWCYYDNDPKNGEIYGKLYNSYAINDPRGLAPLGWHIPTDSEWTTLDEYLGDTNGGKMKAKSGWNNSANGLNSCGFSALPGGIRYDNSNFEGMGNEANWWSCTADVYTGNVYFRGIGDPFLNLYTNYYGLQGYGMSIRCVKD